MNLRIRAAAASLLAGACVLAHAAFPDRPIKLIVPFPPGGNIDATATLSLPSALRRDRCLYSAQTQSAPEDATLPPR